MSDRFACPHCDHHHRWKADFAGKRAKCKCGQIITVPNEPLPLDEPLAVESLPAPEAVPAAHACPSCGVSLDPGAVLCISCGYNLQTGQQVGTAVEEPIAAPAPSASRRGGFPIPHRAKIDEATTPEEQASNWKGWGTIIVGVLIFAYGLYEYYDIKSWEESGASGGKKVHKWVKLGYDMGGAGGVLILFLILAAIVIVVGFLQVRGKLTSRR